MPIRLSEKYLRRVDAAARIATIADYGFMRTPQWEDLALLVTEVQPCFGSTDARTFCYDTFFLWDAGRGADSGVTGRLSDEHNADLLSSFKAAFISELESYPRNYLIEIPLQSVGPMTPIEFSLGSDAAFHYSTADERPFALLDHVVGMQESKWDPECYAWLTLTANGYIDPIRESGTLLDVWSRTKQVAFTLSDLLRKSLLFETPVREARVTCKETGEISFVPLPDGLGEMLARVSFSQHSLGRYLLRRGINVDVESEDPNQVLDRAFTPASVILAHARDYEMSPILAAMEWYIDSMMARNETLAYLAACIGLEAILGDGEEDHRTEAMSLRLADRYTYLLGKTRVERVSLRRDYADVLKLRGKLVHARRSRLRPDDRLMLTQVRAMLKEVVRVEFANLIRHLEEGEDETE